MRLGNKQEGFTIVEVVLFLALSALFITIAFLGVRGRTSAVQFTDSMRSLQTYLVSEQNKVLNGVNSSVSAPSDCAPAASTGESNACILVGRVVSFGQDGANLSATTSDVLYGAKPGANDLAAKNDLTLIEESNPRSDSNVDNYSISWGTQFRLLESVNLGDTGNYDRIGWLRSPGSTRLIPIAYEETVDDLTVISNIYRTSAFETKIGDQVETRLCFEGQDGQLASIRFGDGEGNSSIELVFDDEDCRP